MVSENSSLSVKRYGPAFAVGILGILITWLAEMWVQDVDLASARARFHTAADEKLDRIESSVHGHIDALEATGSLFENIGVVDFKVFQNFVRPLMQRHEGIQAIEWIPRVQQVQRAQYEAKMRDWGYPGYLFREHGPDGKMIPAGDRSEYFPVYYVEPMASNHAVFGFDLGSNPERRLAMEKSRASGKMVASAPNRLVQESGSQAGLLVFTPVYKAGINKNDSAARSAGLVGFGLAVFRIGSLIDAALPRSDNPGLVDVHVFDTVPDGSIKEIYSHASAGESAAQRIERLTAGDHHLRVFNLYGRQWHMIVVPSQSLVVAVGFPWPLILAGLIASVAAAAYLFSLSSRSALIMRQVQDKTKELRTARDGAERAQHAAEVADKAKSAFLATMSHELRTPLTGVIGFIDLLTGKVTDPEQQQILGKLKQAADAQRAIVNDVLDYTKISAGALELETVPFNLTELVETAANTYSPVVAPGVIIGSLIEPSVPRNFLGDPARVQQILNNLVSNAVKFTTKGSITIHVSGELDLKSTACVHYGLVISVQDTGCGIPEEKQANLFNPFIQADSSIAREFGGSGLGLAIVNEIAENMGGTIGLESKIGLGSKFTVKLRLPVTSVASTQTKTGKKLGATIQQLEIGPLRILIADDYKLIREMLSATLVEAGHHVVAVENGYEAVEAVRSAAAEPFDLILMDMHMPIMTGLEAVSLIRALQTPGSQVPIIGLSADVVKDHVESYVQAGLDAYVSKPIDWSNLANAIAGVIGGPPDPDGLGEPSIDVTPDLSGELIVGQVFAEFSAHLSVDDYQHIFKTTLDFFVDCCHQLDGLAGKPDFTKLKALAHSIAGAASTVGAMQAASLAREIADMEEAPDDLAQRTSRLNTLMRRSHMEFNSQFNGLPH